jgi:hypothetical protein
MWGVESYFSTVMSDILLRISPAALMKAKQGVAFHEATFCKGTGKANGMKAVAFLASPLLLCNRLF